MLISKSYEISCSHFIPNHPGKCAGLHGHNYRIDVAVEGDVDAITGMVLDYFDLDNIVRAELVLPFDHKHLNDLVPCLTTAENLAQLWFNRLQEHIQEARHQDLELQSITVYETERCFAKAYFHGSVFMWDYANNRPTQDRVS